MKRLLLAGYVILSHLVVADEINFVNEIFRISRSHDLMDVELLRKREHLCEIASDYVDEIISFTESDVDDSFLSTLTYIVSGSTMEPREKEVFYEKILESKNPKNYESTFVSIIRNNKKIRTDHLIMLLESESDYVVANTLNVLKERGTKGIHAIEDFVLRAKQEGQVSDVLSKAVNILEEKEKKAAILENRNERHQSKRLKNRGEGGTLGANFSNNKNPKLDSEPRSLTWLYWFLGVVILGGVSVLVWNARKGSSAS